MGIRDEFHQSSILACIEELKLGRPVYENDYALLAYTKTPSVNSTTVIAPTLTNLVTSTNSGATSTNSGTMATQSSAIAATTATTTATTMTTISKQIHEMTQYSFSQLRKCDQCHKYLRGIIHQGMLCKKCGIVAHRTCARLGFQSMHCIFGNNSVASPSSTDTVNETINSHTRQSSNSITAIGATSITPVSVPAAATSASSTTVASTTSAAINQIHSGSSITTQLPPPPLAHLSIFGSTLCNMFDVRKCEAPEILQMCCSQIERKAGKHTDIDLYRLYQSNLTSNEMVNLLHTKMNVDLRSINFADYSIQSIVAVMKKFLRELPDPIIPVQFYDYFIQSSSKCYDMNLLNISLPLAFLLSSLMLLNYSMPIIRLDLCLSNIPFCLDELLFFADIYH